LRAVLEAIGVSDVKMEEGSMRVDANVSVRPVGTEELGTRAEIKNMNSVRSLGRAVEYEIARQIDVVESGGRVRQETRLFNSDTGETLSMRSKEEAHDYRYFPEPDLQPLVVDAAWMADIRRDLPELPEARKARFTAAYGLSAYDADVIVRLPHAAEYFEGMVRAGAAPKAAGNWVQGEVRRKLKEVGHEDMSIVPIAADALAELAKLTERGAISSSVAKDVFEKMWTSGRSAQAIVDEEGLAQIGDEAALTTLVQEVISEHPDPVAQYRNGRTATLGFLVGQVMKASGGKANPKLVNELMRKALAQANP